jgi:3-hydroxy-9,10-secoandrosta-1,3,5(10)-triene-9,17-dione monooxygenase
LVTRDDLLRRARALQPAIRERAETTEALRRIPDETISDLRDAGLLRVISPERYGGDGFEPDVMFDIGMEIARACGSTGWCYCVMVIHNWMVGQWPERFQDEFFAMGPDAVSSSAFAPTGRLEPVDGGYRLAGRWEFSSGCDHGTWALLGARNNEGAFWAMLPRSDYQIVDTWFVSGLQGTGSKDIEVNSAFVPPHRLLRFPAQNERLGEGWRLHKRPSYRLPIWPMIINTLAAPIVGMAQGAVDEFTASLRGKTGPGRTADSVALQLRLAEAATEVDTARILLRHDVAEMLRVAASPDFALSELDALRYRRDAAYVAKLCVQATGRLFEASGGHGIYATQAIQRFFRDVNAASHHGSLFWDAVAEQYGKSLLGRPPP